MSAHTKLNCPNCFKEITVCIDDEDYVILDEQYEVICDCGKRIIFNGKAYDINDGCPDKSIKAFKLKK